MSASQPLTHRRALGAAVLVTLLWSSSWVLIRWGLDDEALQPIGFAGLRYALAAMILLGWIALDPRRRVELKNIDRASLKRVLLLGVVFYAVTQSAVFIAIDNQPAATTSLVLSWTPLVVALGSFAISEGFTTRQLLGAVLVIVGAWAYFSGELGFTLVGMLAAVVGMLANSASTLMGRNVNRAGRLSPLAITSLSMAVGAVILVVAGMTIEGLDPISTRGWLIIAWLALVNTAFAFTLWNLSMRRLTALESAAINNTMLIQIALLGWLFLDEPLGRGEIFGILLVSVGIVMAQSWPKHPVSTPHSRP